jgi:AsmA protein
MDDRGVPVLEHTRSLRNRIFRYFWRLLLAASLAIVIVGLIAPYVNASAFGGRIRQALETSLGRRVRFDQVRFALFSGPGFSLTNVVIDEDPRYGLEPFAFVPTLQARVRVGSLLRGRLAFYSLRLDGPSLNVVKREDGGWNVVELVSRLTAPRHLPLDLFPAFSVSDARLDFKLGARKTTLYVTETDLSVYPQRSGKLYIQFSGSPARTDRAGNGFGHIRGTANWYQKPVSSEANRLELDVTLDPSNLSELTTLFQGHDLGIHGTLSSHMRIEGPGHALRLAGNLRLADVRRWDLLPARGEDWQVAYQGTIDLAKSSLVLQTVSPNASYAPPVTLQLRVNQLLSQPSWSVVASLNHAPAAQLVPIARRMAIPIPEELKLSGTVDGAVGYAKDTGFSGGVELKQTSIELPNLPVLRAESVIAQISKGAIQFEPAKIETAAIGTIQLGGELATDGHAVSVSLRPADFPVTALRSTISAWFAAAPALDLLRSGTVTGEVDFSRRPGSDPAWSGKFNFSDAEIQPPGIAQPLTAAQGQVRFDPNALEIEKFSASLGTVALAGSYRSITLPRPIERLSLQADTVDLREIEAALEPTFRAQGFLARLGVGRRVIPPWLERRHLQTELSISQFSINGATLGSLKTRLLWAGPRIRIPSFDLKLADGALHGDGTLNVSASAPRYQFSATMTGYRWRGGMLTADGTFETSGMGSDVLANLRAEGTFSGHDVSPSASDVFDRVSGAFEFSFDGDWPNLKISRLEASQREEAWTGNAATQSDGKLVIDLEHEGRQRRVISGLDSQNNPASSALAGSTASQ